MTEQIAHEALQEIGVSPDAPRPPETPPGSMSGSVVRGVNWSTASRLLVQVLQFIAGIVLARLLTPADFGLVASVYVVSNFAQLFFDMGLGQALIHLQTPTDQQKSTVFWINVLGGFVFAGLLAGIAPFVADFYDQPQLVWLTPLVGLSFTFSFGVVHLALLQRDLKFRTVAAIEISSAIVGNIVTVVLALTGIGPIALAIGPVGTSLMMSVLAVTAVRWRPHSFISRGPLRELWKFSGGLLGFNVVNYWGRNADNLLVGRFLGTSPLGFYNRGYNLMLLPVTQVTGGLGRVMFPALTQMKGDPDRVRRAYLRTVLVLNCLTVPCLVGLAVTAPALVPFLWGPGWTGTIPILVVLCIAGIPQCLTASLGWLYQSQGQTGLMFKMGLVGTAVGVAAIVIGLHWGVVGVAWGVAFRYWVMMPFGVHTAGRGIGLTAGHVLRRSAPTLAASGVMALAVWSVALLPGLTRSGGFTLLAQVLLGVAIYPIALRVLARDVFAEIRGLIPRRG